MHAALLPIRLLTACVATLVAGILQGAEHGDPAAIAFFEKDVRPVLTEHCLKCHGGETKIRGGLRLTSREEALAGGDTGPAFDAKDVKGSLLIKMINYHDDDHQMPPKGQLPKEKIAILTKWVELGGPWKGELQGALPRDAKKPEHEVARSATWGYGKPERPAAPAVSAAGGKWIANPIDAFILAGLEAKKLKPAPPASRAALIRRASYDLTGLPPTPQEVAAFVADSDPQAYEKLLDRLLASPRYGEKWGRHWLDLVRFAETNGYERDGDKPHAWRYRDYVIGAFNRDLPYDRFLTEQLAGDELEQPTPESITATGYYRLGLWDDEPADRELASYDYLDGIVATTSQAMLGMTVGCARCHDHKKDPILQEDYYRMLAFFTSIQPMQKEGANIETMISRDPVAHQAHERALAEARAALEAIEAEFIAKGGAKAGSQDIEDLAYRFYRSHWEKLPDFDMIKAESEGKLPGGRFDISPATRESDFGFVFTGTLVVPETGRYTFFLDSDDGTRLTVGGKRVVEHDGVHGTGDVKQAEVDLAKGRLPIRLDYFQGIGGKGLMVAWSGPKTPRRPLAVEGASASLADQMKAQGAKVLGDEGFKRYQALRRKVAQMVEDSPADAKALSVTERAEPVDTFLLIRGNPAAKGKRVEPGFPKVLGAPEPVIKPVVANGRATTGRRTALARWITDPANPMTARVMANRLWQFHFGRGIVASSNDFGALGDKPTHPQLLDWLASELVARGWKLKAMHKLLMTSSAYRMAAQELPEIVARDPANELWGRFPMRRLSAEEIRDSILFVDGSLNERMGGPSVFPPMPKEVLATSSTPGSAWGRSSPEDEVRRSVYIKVKRSLLYPMLSQHDFADTDSSCAMRFTTTVPTQSLTMMNSEFMNQRAAVFAKRLAAQAPSAPDKQVRLGLELIAQRPPDQAQVKRSLDFIQDLRKDGMGEEQAMTMLCLLLLNLNEFVYLD